MSRRAGRSDRQSPGSSKRNSLNYPPPPLRLGATLSPAPIMLFGDNGYLRGNLAGGGGVVQRGVVGEP